MQETDENTVSVNVISDSCLSLKHHRSNIDRLGYFRSDRWGHRLLQRKVEHEWRGQQGSCAISSGLQKVTKPKPDTWEFLRALLLVEKLCSALTTSFSSSEFFSYLNSPGQPNLPALQEVCVLEVLSEPNSVIWTRALTPRGDSDRCADLLPYNLSASILSALLFVFVYNRMRK